MLVTEDHLLTPVSNPSGNGKQDITLVLRGDEGTAETPAEPTRQQGACSHSHWGNISCKAAHSQGFRSRPELEQK